MNRLAHNRCYLCGPMENTSDFGTTWREDIKLQLQHLKIIWLDPTKKPTDICIEDEKFIKTLATEKKRENYRFLKDNMYIVRSVDLRMVDICDFLIVHLNLSIPTCGTYEEIFWANRMMKPILVHMQQGKSNASNWLFGTIPYEMIFSTWNELEKYLLHIAHDERIDRMDRWYFFDWMGE